MIRSNVDRSGNRQSRLEAQRFDENLLGNIESIQRRLQKKSYQFAPAIGVAASKGKGKTGKRAIVVAPVADRIVQRAILDTLYAHASSKPLRDALLAPTSVGGVPGRGIGHALALIEKAEDDGATYAIRSDIRNFFPSFPRAEVISFIKAEIDDIDFVDLFERAVTIELKNRDALGEDSELFPLGEDGVAQGSPLSVLAGNIALRRFDEELNRRNVRCVRYIDDFLILARTGKAARKALKAGRDILHVLNLEAYAPSDGSGKAWEGPLNSGFDFLGYSVVRGLNPPSAASRSKLIANIESEIAEGKKWISQVVRNDLPQTKRLQCYVQTLNQIDGILRGWAGAFQYSRSLQGFAELDARIDTCLGAFERWFGELIHSRSAASTRRGLGIRLLSDSEPVSLPEVVLD